MSIESIRERVEASVQARLIPVLFERYKRSHMKKNWRDCECGYCDFKRRNHQYLQFAPFHLNWAQKQEWRDNRIKYGRAALAIEADKIESE